jgi:nitrogen-specific signal transduction histidine kinase
MQPNNESEERARFLRWAQLTCAGEVAAMVAHDINNAVTGVMSYTELAQMGLPSWSEAGTYLQKTLDQAKRISSLANQLLLISHEAAYTPVREDVRGSLEAACALVRRRLEKDGIAFQQRLDIADACVMADTARLLLTWLGLILVARSGLLQSPAESVRTLRLGAETASRGGSPWARIAVEVGADTPPPAQFAETLRCAETDGAPLCREAVLYAAARAHIAELGGALSLRQTDGGFVFDVELPLTD